MVLEHKTLQTRTLIPKSYEKNKAKHVHPDSHFNNTVFEV